jgi:hypothetical protein
MKATAAERPRQNQIKEDEKEGKKGKKGKGN